MGSSPSFPVVSLPRDRIVVVTGGNTGIGYETAKHIAMMGATVIIACRSEQRATDLFVLRQIEELRDYNKYGHLLCVFGNTIHRPLAIRRMNEEYQDHRTKGKLEEGHINEDKLPVEFMKLDLASLKSTMDFIEAFKSSGRKLHVLLCNAGLAVVPRGHTEDGYETHFQVNYLGHFLIVAHLLPIMKSSGEDCRIVFTSSLAHKGARFDLEKAQAKNPSDYGRMLYYSNSKMYQIQHMFCLSRRLRGSDVTVTSMHPGTVSTEITRNYSDLKCFSCLVSCLDSIKVLRTPYQGAVTLVDLAVNPENKGVKDGYFVDCKSASIARLARNEQYQEDLWNYSVECLRQYLPPDIAALPDVPQDGYQ